MSEATVLRSLGNSELRVSPVGLGCWPIAGVSTLGTNDRDSLATLHRAIDCGVNFFDTAFAYGYEGESERLIAQVLSARREEVIIATKVGQYFDQDKQRVVDGSPDSLAAQAEESLRRLDVEAVDVLYLHLPDPKVPLEESAMAICKLVNQGKARYAGVSNVNQAQLRKFHEICPVVVQQPPFNMMQQDTWRQLQPTAEELEIGTACYWALMKGLLAGKLKRDHQFAPNDKRLTYAIFQGSAWQRSQDFLDKLRSLSSELNCTVAQLVVAWTLRQPGIDVALCGAKRPEQIQETAQAMHLDLPAQALAQIDGWIREHEAAANAE